MTPAGIEPATFRFVAQHLNHCATAIPMQNVYILAFYTTGILYFETILLKQYSEMAEGFAAKTKALILLLIGYLR